MIRSLRARLLLLTLVVAGVALATAGVLSRIGVRHEIARLEMLDRHLGPARGAGVLPPTVLTPGPQADTALAHMADALGHDLVLVDTTGRVVAASTPELRRARVTRGPGARAVIEAEVPRGGVRTRRRSIVLGMQGPPLRGPDGAVIGTLYPFPRDLDGGHGPLLLAVNRWLMLALVAAAALAVALSMALSRRILGPVDALTAAVRRLAGGDLAQRVPVRTHDEIGELAQAFNGMADALETQQRLRRTLVGDVAHELRTPLTNLRCQLEALQDGLLAPDPAAVRSLHEETLLLTRLVDDLQELALAEAGQLPLHRARVPVAAAVEAAVSAVRPRAAERGVTLEATVPSGMPDVDADPARLAQILRNLLANALAHVREGGRIDVIAAATGAEVAFAVQDSGAGVPPEHLPHIFDRFYRADLARARATGGAGLGLAIVRQLVTAHGGAVRAANTPGSGARFEFTLPAADRAS